MSDQFKWTNISGRYDLIGRPLQPINKYYADCVEDVEINPGNWFTQRFFPYSHTGVWEDKRVLNMVTDRLVNTWLGINELETK